VGPSQFSVNLRMSRTFGFGNKTEATAAPAASPDSAFGGGRDRGPGGDRGGQRGGGPGGGGPRGGCPGSPDCILDGDAGKLSVIVRQTATTDAINNLLTRNQQ